MTKDEFEKEAARIKELLHENIKKKDGIAYVILLRSDHKENLQYSKIIFNIHTRMVMKFVEIVIKVYQNSIGQNN